MRAKKDTRPSDTTSQTFSGISTKIGGESVVGQRSQVNLLRNPQQQQATSKATATSNEAEEVGCNIEEHMKSCDNVIT
jgi:hypothetical protein